MIKGITQEEISLMISMDDKSLKDGVEVNLKDIYEWSNQTGKTPKTAAHWRFNKYYYSN